MNLVKVFLLSILLGSVGAAVGGAIGNSLGAGGVLAGGFVAGVVFVVASAYLSTRWHWIRIEQRLWMMLGGGFGFALACMVALATIMTPGSLMVSTLLIGLGAVLGAVVGISPHQKA